MLADTRLAVPTLDRMHRLVDVLGHPERSAPVIHVTGTNGKTSTARCLTSLLMAKGLRVGTFTSPHLESINERIATDGEPIDDDSLADVLAQMAAIEPLVAGPGSSPLGSGSGPGPGSGSGGSASLGSASGLAAGSGLTWFEILAGAAMLWFADRPVDVAVYEVGMGGRWDATNVADASVAVVTNVGLDHVEFLGPTRADVAMEKAGIVKPGSILVLGETDPELLPIFEAQEPASLWLAGREFDAYRNDLAVDGRRLDIRTPAANYDAVWLDLHGSYQGHNFAVALAAAEAFFAVPLDDRMVRQVASTVRSPGRLEIVRRSPTVVLDGAKNLEGATAAAAAMAEEFRAATSQILVVGMLKGKDPAQMLAALDAHRARMVVTCTAPSPRAYPASVLAEAARSLGVRTVIEADAVSDALDAAMAAAGPDDVVLVTGSLYVVGEARGALAVG